jgi:hypothetical protein
MDGVKEAASHEEARVLLEKRKEIPPSEDLANRVEPAKKRKRGSSKPKGKVVPTPDNPVVVEDDDDGSSDSGEPVVEAVPLRTNFPGI